MPVDVDAPGATTTATRPRTSVAAGSVARSIGEAAWAAFALLTGVIIARHLGPVGKGVVSSMSYMVALIAPAATFGLGEAGVTRSRTGEDMRRVLGATIVFLGASTAVGAALLFGVLVVQFGDDLAIFHAATVAAMVSVPAMAGWMAFSLLVEAEGGLIASAAIKVLVGAATAVATIVLVLGFDLAQAGAMAATAGGFLTGVAATLGWLWLRRGIVPAPRWDPAYLRRAIPIGIPVQTSYLLVGLSARMDLLIVQSIKGSAAAGFYSVALTMGQLVFYAPVAVAVASYPVAANMTAGEVVPFIERAARTGVAAGLLSAVVLVPTLPFILPALFGPAFSTSTGMALVLLAAGLLQGLQWVTCRLWAAQGRGGLLALTCGVTLAVMVALDLVLVPAHGGMGAAIAAVIAAAAAAVLAVAGHRRYAGDRASLLGFVPRVEDFARIAALPRAVLRMIGSMRRA